MRPKITPTSVENKMREEDFIVSKTDTKGNILYCNRIFMEFAKYEENELIGSQHNIVRHPDMPRCIFKLMWDTITQKKEMNAYVKNLAKDGSYYWVFANVTPVMNNSGQITGYYSVRRKPNERKLKIIEKLYSDLVKIEQQNGISNGMQESEKMLNNALNEKGQTYEEFVFSL